MTGKVSAKENDKKHEVGSRGMDQSSQKASARHASSCVLFSPATLSLCLSLHPFQGFVTIIYLIEANMGSEDPTPLVDKDNVVVEAVVDRSCPSKKNKERVPRKIHKAEREKLKREHLNDIFLDLANALELTQQNNGKASTLNEATRILRDMFGQIEDLKKENAALLSESHYVTVEKNELREENSALEAQIEKLQGELEARLAQSKRYLNVPPPEVQQVELTSHFPGDCLRLPTADPALQQAPTVFVVPLHPDLQAYPVPDTAQLASNPNSQVSKPHARYPTPADSWPSQLLGNQPTPGNEF